MSVCFVMIDLENVRAEGLKRLPAAMFHVKVFLGVGRTKIPLEMAQAMQSLGFDAEYIQMEGTGRNALDFHIAYYIGRLSAENSAATFVIVSKDTGFDPLITHLKRQGISCRRCNAICQIPLSNEEEALELPQRAEAVVANLAKRPTSRPRTLKTLSRTIKSLFVNQVSDEEVGAVIEILVQRGAVEVTDNKITYLLP